MRVEVQELAQDPQRKLLYAMEFRELRGQWRGNKTSKKTLDRYMRLVCRLYGLPRLVIRYRTIATKGVYLHDARGCRITLDRQWGCNAVTLAHELAHYVTHKKFPATKQDHGARFVRVYAEVLHILRLMPIEGMKAICRKHGVRMARAAV